MRHPKSSSKGFTLVELLVVIGIIAVLIAILLPTLLGARRASLQLVCAAHIQQVMVTMQAHALSHHGYLPLAGLLAVTQTDPDGLDDLPRAKYDYLSFDISGVDDLLMSLTASLSKELGDPHIVQATSVDDLNTVYLDPNSFLKHFRCPAHLPEPGPVHDAAMFLLNPASAMGPPLAWKESQSYVYNEAALGWDDSMARTRGQIARIRQQSQTMLMADGLGGGVNRAVFYFATVYNKVPNGPVTLADALLGNASAGDPQNFDRARHRGKMNIGFFDGHVESRYISAGDLANVYLIAPP